MEGGFCGAGSNVSGGDGDQDTHKEPRVQNSVDQEKDAVVAHRDANSAFILLCVFYELNLFYTRSATCNRFHYYFYLFLFHYIHKSINLLLFIFEIHCLKIFVFFSSLFVSLNIIISNC